MRNFSAKILLSVLLLAAGGAALPAAPVATQLTADAMDYDMESGEFKAQGHVTLKREDVTLTSAYGEASTKTQKARLWRSVHVFGTYRGEKIDAVCAELTADFSVSGGSYAMKGSVDAAFGSRVLRAATARLSGQTFGAEDVTHFEDKDRSMVMTCAALSGDYDAQGLRAAEGKGNVTVVQQDEEKVSRLWCDALSYSRAADTLTGTGSAKIHVQSKSGRTKETTIECEKLVYSVGGNVVTATGNARAVQDGRRISAQTLIYHPDTGRLEAKGTPRISVDLTNLKPSPRTPAKNGAPTAGSEKGGKK